MTCKYDVLVIIILISYKVGLAAVGEGGFVGDAISEGQIYSFFLG